MVERLSSNVVLVVAGGGRKHVSSAVDSTAWW
jgi:hypothetical protein